MNNTAYRTRVPSPFQVARKPYVPPVEKMDTIQQEIQKLVGRYEFSAEFAVDTQTATTLKHIPGLIAFICTIRKGDKVIGQGRGTTVINQMNRFIVRTINYAFNASLVDGIVRSTKILDVFRPDAQQHPWNGPSAPKPVSYGETEQYDAGGDGITDKQKSYLLQLIQTNVADEDDREQQISQLEELTREEASTAIKSFTR